VATWRDGFVLFHDFATVQLHKQPTTMKLPDITPSLIRAFLDHLARDRGNAVRTLCVPVMPGWRRCARSRWISSTGPVAAQELVDRTFIEHVRRQVAHRHPVCEVRYAFQATTRRVRCIPASSQALDVRRNLRRQWACKQPGLKQGVDRFVITGVFS